MVFFLELLLTGLDWSAQPFRSANWIMSRKELQSGVQQVAANSWPSQAGASQGPDSFLSSSKRPSLPGETNTWPSAPRCGTSLIYFIPHWVEGHANIIPWTVLLQRVWRHVCMPLYIVCCVCIWVIAIVRVPSMTFTVQSLDVNMQSNCFSRDKVQHWENIPACILRISGK